MMIANIYYFNVRNTNFPENDRNRDKVIQSMNPSNSREHFANLII